MIKNWMLSNDTYTVRFAIGMLMEHFLDEDYDLSYPEMVAEVRSEEYYINMMVAWYFATALAKQYETILPYFENHKLDTWTHNKSIQKAVERSAISSAALSISLSTLTLMCWTSISSTPPTSF